MYKQYNFWLYLTAQATSFASSWALYIFLNWKIYTDYSINSLAAYAFVSGIPSLIFMNLGGIFADKYNKKNSLILLHFFSMLINFFFIFSLISENITLETILFYGAIISTMAALCRPFNQAILPEIFDRDDIPKILGINSMLFNLNRMFVPFLVGIILIYSNFFLAIMILSLSIVSLFFYCFLRLNTSRSDLVAQTDDGKSFIVLFNDQKNIFRRYPELWYIFSLAFVTSATLGSYTFLMPALNDFLHYGDSLTLTYLYGISGAGTLFAGFLKSFGKINIRRNLLSALGGLASLSMVFFIYNLNFYVECVALFVLAFSILLIFISCNQIVYEIVSHEYHGRVLSLLSLAIIGIAPFSNALTGVLVSSWSLEIVCLLYATICGLVSLSLAIFFDKISLEVRKQS